MEYNIETQKDLPSDFDHLHRTRTRTLRASAQNLTLVDNQWSMYDIGGRMYKFRRLTARQSRELTEDTRFVSKGYTRSARNASQQISQST
jgi:hypothetical protein